jgi:hypothetical protein
MDKLHKFALHRRGFLNGLIGCFAGGSLIAATGTPDGRENFPTARSRFWSSARLTTVTASGR